MMKRWAFRTKRGQAVAMAALLFGAGMMTPGTAAGLISNSCKPGQTLVRHDTKFCKPNRFRAAYPLMRACCMKANGDVHCRSYHKCPKHSISGLL